MHQAGRVGALALGPGLGRAAGTTAFVRDVLEAVAPPGRGRRRRPLAPGRAPAVAAPAVARRRSLTPHAGEAARLLGRERAEVEADRLACARELAELTGAVVVLKGAGTITCGPARRGGGQRHRHARPGHGRLGRRADRRRRRRPGQGAWPRWRARPPPSPPTAAPPSWPDAATAWWPATSSRRFPAPSPDEGAWPPSAPWPGSTWGRSATTPASSPGPPAGAELLAVVKADGYGHGAAAVARAALEGGARRLGVATAAEAEALRAAGLDAPVLVMGPLIGDEWARAVAAGAEVAVWTPQAGAPGRLARRPGPPQARHRHGAAGGPAGRGRTRSRPPHGRRASRWPG